MTIQRGRGPGGRPPGPRGSGRGQPGSGRGGPARPGGRAGGGSSPADQPRPASRPGRPAGHGRQGDPPRAARPARAGAERGSGRGDGRRDPNRRPDRRPDRRPARRRPRRIIIRLRDPVRRLNVGLLLITFVLSLFAGRLVQLQGLASDGYARQAMQQRLVTIDLPAVRGQITDAQGQPLAMTVDARAIYADPSRIDPARRPQIAQTLASILDLNPATVLKDLSKPNTQFRYIARGVKPDRARMVSALDFPGIGTLPEYRRIYPNNAVGANVVGYVGGDGNGLGGLEYTMNGMLAGRGGWQRVEISRDGQHIPMGEDQTLKPVPGRGLRLTLLRDLQYKAQAALEKQVKATRSKSGSVIVMDPHSGQILAMATAPGFDPNDLANADQRNLGNRAVEEAFEPGSTNKVITAAAAIEKGGVTPDTAFVVPDRITRLGRTFHDSHPHRTQRLTFGGVLATSSNVGTILASERISQQTLYDFLRGFGFGEPTGVRLPGETSGLLRPPSQWSGTDRYPIVFGQTVSVNALQMASVYATIANGGVRVSPTIVAGTTDENGGFTPAAAPAQRRVISARTAREIIHMLEGVASSDGTAPEAQIPGYRVAGKTGTAEKVNPACGCYRGGGYTASFAGIAPADDPQLVVQVVLQDPKGAHYGGEVAAPVFKDVMSFALQSRKIPPTGNKSPKIRIYAGH